MALADLKKHELVALCKEWSIDATGTKAEMIALLESDDRDIEDESFASAGHVEAMLAIEEIADPDMSGFDMDMEGDEAFIKALYLHVLKRDATMGDLLHYNMMLSAGLMERAKCLTDLVRSEEYRLANCA